MRPVLVLDNVVVVGNTNSTNVCLFMAPAIDCNREHAEVYFIQAVKTRVIVLNITTDGGMDTNVAVNGNVVDSKKLLAVQVETSSSG